MLCALGVALTTSTKEIRMKSRPVYIDVPMRVDGDIVDDLLRLYRTGGWNPDFLNACKEALQEGTLVIDEYTVTRLGDIIEASNRARRSTEEITKHEDPRV